MMEITNEAHYRVTLQVIATLRAMVASWEPLPPGIDPGVAKAHADKANGLAAELAEDARAYRVKLIFEFLCAIYVQRADDRQKAMGLQYTEAETHDLAEQIALFIEGQRL